MKMVTPRSEEPDMTLVAELLEDIQRHPPAVAAKTLLAQHYVSIGWFDAASDYVEELKRNAPNDPEVAVLIKDLQASNVSAQQKKFATPQTGLSVRIQAIIQGQTPPEVVAASPLGKSQAVARAVQSHSDKALDIVIADLEDNLGFMRGRTYVMSDDSIRDGLVKRMREVEMALPETLKIYCELGFMYIEHENLKRKYANDQTMLMEPISDIPRYDFYVTEDNYAWDLSELVQAITANGGVMRNPLSKEMFTQKDVRGILASPHGKPLAALQIAQNEMSQGVRPETIVRMDKLADVMLVERERTAMKSRKAMDEFQAYIATLPEREQKAIEAFRCPAFDRHAGKAYDSTIGQTIRDAKSTELCIHKAGDFIKQAAAYLKEKRGAAPATSESEKSCVVM
ncbi:hypothetical protein SLS60_006464 [Paraconiothyrium brasiliense]|uniref:Tetratricopeptide repeat protein n=1 Tax=Paraconiothyrium brasiliense TaxID=300254 RepID=A0ABR3RAT0_9PLEO